MRGNALGLEWSILEWKTLKSCMKQLNFLA